MKDKLRFFFSADKRNIKQKMSKALGGDSQIADKLLQENEESGIV